MKIEIVMDLICSASYIGYTRFARAAETWRARGGQLDVTFLPFQLDPDATASGEPLLTALRRKFGDHAAAETEQVAAAAARDGLRLDYSQAVHTTTLSAHQLIAVASRQGLGEAMAERLFRAYFTDGLNIADPTTLTGLAGQTGVRAKPLTDDGSSAVRAGLHQVRSLGITTIPVFRYPDESLVTGVHSEATFLTNLERCEQRSSAVKPIPPRLA